MIGRWLRHYYVGFRNQMVLNQPIRSAFGAAYRHANWWVKNERLVAARNADLTARQQYWGA